MPKLCIKPLSVNDAWQGRRFKTDKYKRYERDLLRILPGTLKVPDGPLVLIMEFGFSSNASDWDNPIKPLQDILQKKYGFNDSRITIGIGVKVKVSKGQEYIKFDICEAENGSRSRNPLQLLRRIRRLFN